MGFFYGSAVEDSSACGAGGILYFSDKLSFSFKAGLGASTNNIVELCALKLLLTLAKMKDCAKIHIFGDSQLVINWAKGKFRMHNLELSLILQEVHKLSDCFELVQFQHIYRERNSLADTLGKDGVRINEGYWLINELREDSSSESYQIF